MYIITFLQNKFNLVTDANLKIFNRSFILKNSNFTSCYVNVFSFLSILEVLNTNSILKKKQKQQKKASFQLT